MSRWVVPQKAGMRARGHIKTLGSAGEGEDKPDGAIGRITKYIPAEILSAYTALFTLLTGFSLIGQEQIFATLGLAGLFLVVTIAYIWVKAGQGPIRRAHLLVSPIAFLAWVYPISSGMLADYYYPLAAFGLLAVAIALSIFVKPVE